MPTGYTAPIENGEITTLSAYALICARAFGALIELRDDSLDTPIPQELKADTTYHDRAMTQARTRLNELSVYTLEQAQQAALKAHENALEEWNNEGVRAGLIRARYEAMLRQVEQWEPPTPDHTELKTFMLKQIGLCYTPLEQRQRYSPEPQLQTWQEWLEAQMEQSASALAYHTSKRLEVLQRTAERNEWLRALRESLKQP